MKNTSPFVHFLYATYVGRLILKLIMTLRLDRVIACFLHSPLSKPIIGCYAKINDIPLTDNEKAGFRSFSEFFSRTREPMPTDHNPSHLISPCDGWLSVYPIASNSHFAIKSSTYQLKDFLQDEALSQNYRDGLLLMFRLCGSDYHHYSYIDDGYQGKNHRIPGVLHSVQPIACEHYPVFVLNKRSWCLLTTEHFGPVVQCEIGALVVGEIFNAHENTRFQKGAEKGHFELGGSTIIQLFEANKITLRPEILEQLRHQKEVRVLQGDWIGNAISD